MGTYRFRIERREDKATKIVYNAVTHVYDLVEDQVYQFPEDLQHESLHLELFKLSIIKNNVNQMSKINQYRKPKVNIQEKLVKEYFDESENLIFKGRYLEECDPPVESFQKKTTEVQQTSRIETKETNVELLNRIEELEQKLNKKKKFNLNEVEKQFALTKFNGKGDPIDFIETFDDECERFQIEDESEKVQILRVFLTQTAEKWYQSKSKKLDKTDWSVWKSSFVSVFCKKSWSTVKLAINFKYIAGSYLDYMLNKESMLTDIEPDMIESSMVNLIVIGLPEEIQEKLDRDVVKSMDKLFEEVAKFDHQTQRKTKPGFKNEKNQSKGNSRSTTRFERNPCELCRTCGYENNYHPENICRNRERAERIRASKKVNCTTEATSDEEQEIYNVMNVNNRENQKN